METLSIAVVTHDYPTQKSSAGAFVRARVELYRRAGHSVEVHSRYPPWNGLAFGKPDVIAAHYPLPEYVIPTCEPFYGRIPIVAYLHGAEAIRVPGKPILWGLKAKLALRAFLRQAAGSVTESVWMRDEIRRYLGITPTVIPNPLDETLFKLSEHTSRNGVCLRPAGWKYGTDMIDQIRQIVSGDGIRIEKFEPVVPREELPELLARFGFVVAPSRLEGQGLLSCEALATGMPAASTKVGAIPEFIKDDFSALADHPTPTEIAEAVRVVHSRLPLTPIQARSVRESVTSICGSERIVRADIDLFRALMSRDQIPGNE